MLMNNECFRCFSRKRLYGCWFSLLFLSVLALSVQASSLHSVVGEMLDEADRDLAAGRLQSPPNKNAYDRYQAVLLLDKGNQRAALGIRNIAGRYMEKSRAYIQKWQWRSAKSMLTKAIAVNGRTAETTRLAADIDNARKVAKTQSRAVEPAAIDWDKTTFVLSRSGLKQRTRSMVNQLAALGQRVEETREYVLIYARNDSEGRWIYRQMNKASPSYRLRGNIKRHKKPRIVLESPLDE